MNACQLAEYFEFGFRRFSSERLDNMRKALYGGLIVRM
jgi:hypothetical protein